MTRPIYQGAIEFELDNALVAKNVICKPNESLIAAVGLDNARAGVSTTFRLVCDTLHFLSCKNISLHPHDNDPKQVRRAIKRHGGTPESYRYHTLVVRPAGASKNSPAQEIGIMPRHMCRGHMQHYGLAAEHGHPDGKDRGLLFGKYGGKFYVPPVYKGDKKNGVVEKDYEIPVQ